MTEQQKATPAQQESAQVHQQAAKAVSKVAGGREDAKAESQKAGEKATEQVSKANEKQRTENPDSPQTHDVRYHAPSTPDQASEAEKDGADNPRFVGVEGEYAPDNEIEANVRRMAADGMTSAEIAAYKADALAKL